MQAIFFPMTYISEMVCEAVRTCFQRVRIYQPTRRLIPPPLLALSQKGLIDMAVPAENDDKKIETLVRDYRSWAQLHQGGALDYLKRQDGSPPFFDDTATERIRSEIRQGGGASAPFDSLLNARLFLQIAQEYDLESEEVMHKLFDLETAERNLFRTVAGKPEAAAQPLLGPQLKEETERAGFMIRPKIAAWARLFLQDAAFDPEEAPTAFVTIGREVLEILMEGEPAAEPVFKVSSLPIVQSLSQGYGDWQNGFGRIIDALPQDAGIMAAELAANLPGLIRSDAKVDLTLYRMAKEPPTVFFARRAGWAPAPEDGENRPDKTTYTLLGGVEIR